MRSVLLSGKPEKLPTFSPGADERKIFMGMFEKLKDWLMPPEIEEDYEEEEEEQAAQKSAKKVEAKTTRLKEEVAEAVAVNASPSNSVTSRSRFTTDSVRNFNVEQSVRANKPSDFTYKKAGAPSLNVEVYAPKNFDQVRSIGDQLKRKNAVVVNYEMLGMPEQRRICDFLNGLIYVLDGDVKRVSNNIVLYVPAGVDVTEAITVAG